MALNRVCFGLLLLVCLNSVAAKPFFRAFLCDWICDYYDDDDATTTTAASDDDYCDCTPAPQRRTTTAVPTTVAGTTARMPDARPSSFFLDVSPGLSLMITQDGDKVNVMVRPSEGTATTGAPAATTAGGATTAAATTAAGTTATDSTTAAATTAAAK